MGIFRKIASNFKGFTLIEIMLVITIIAILAAVAVPQFLAYRMRSYNAMAKAIVHNLTSDNANLKAEVGIYGHTESGATTLNAADSGTALANTVTNPALAVSATPGATGIGARLSATNAAATKTFSVGTTLGPHMLAHVIDFNNANDESTYHAYAKHFKGDTAYGIDADVINQICSVSNSNDWPNNVGLGATATVPALPPANDLANSSGGGNPTDAWIPIQ